MHQLNTSHIQRILDVARRIEAPRRMVKRTISGAELLDMGFPAWDGKPINPTAQYDVPVMKEANIGLVIIRKCREEGMDEFDSAARELGRGTAKLLDDGSLLLYRNTVR